MSIPGEDLEKRFTYHPPTTDAKVARYKAIRDTAHSFAHLINSAAPDGREKSLAITHLEEAVMWANAAIARGE